MYDVYYALRLPPDGQIELQRCTADFRIFFCPFEIDTRDVQNCQKAHPLLTSCMMLALLIGYLLPMLIELKGCPSFRFWEFYWQPCHM